MRVKPLAAICAALAVTVFLAPSPEGAGPLSPALSEVVGAKPAAASASERAETRRVVRRTMRRIDRRQDRREAYLTALPRGCVVQRVGALDYYRCGAVYYEPALLDQRVVYVVVTP